MKEVILVQHLREGEDGCDYVKVIGVYSDRLAATAAIERALRLPGFRDAPNGFSADSYLLDDDHWTAGFGCETESDTKSET